MSMPSPQRREPVPIQGKALDNLRYIRETMERAGSFTSISGFGMIAMGGIALGAAGLAASATGTRWLGIWLGAAVLALAIGYWSADRKARMAGTPLLNGPGRSFLYSFSIPALVAVLVTIAAYVAGSNAHL